MWGSMNLQRFEHILKRDFDILYEYIISEGGVESFFNSLYDDSEVNMYQFNDAYFMIVVLETLRDNKERLEFALL